MSKINLHDTTYYVSGLQGFTLTEALQLWKSKFETIKHFKRDVITHPGLQELGDFVEEMWEGIIPVSVQEALREQNMERRRVMFDCIGVARLFSQLQPVLIDKQVISKKRTRWDETNKPYVHQYEDVYELYQIEGDKLFKLEREWLKPEPVFAVRCWCTTTNREYWIYVPKAAALIKKQGDIIEQADAVEAIAWTVRIDITHPNRVFRQGDIIIVEESESSAQVKPYHLSKEQYLDLFYSET